MLYTLATPLVLFANAQCVTLGPYSHFCQGKDHAFAYGGTLYTKLAAYALCSPAEIVTRTRTRIAAKNYHCPKYGL